MTHIMMKPLVLLNVPMRIEWKRKERGEVIFSLDCLMALQLEFVMSCQTLNIFLVKLDSLVVI